MNSRMTKRRKWLTYLILPGLVLFSMILPVFAEEKPADPTEIKPTMTFSVDTLSQYVFRGLGTSMDSAVIQPSATFGYDGFSLNFWGNLDTSQKTNNPWIKVPVGVVKDNGRATFDEVDITFSYTRELFKDFSVSGGTVNYLLYYSPYNAMEIFGGFSYNFPWFTAAFTTYKNITNTPGWWFQLDITKSIPLPMIYDGVSLDIGASFGYLIAQDKATLLNLEGTTGTFSDFNESTLTATLKLPITKNVTIGPKIGVSFPLTGAAANYLEANSFDSNSTHVWGGLNVTATF